MPKLFISYRTVDGISEDHEGIDLPTLGHARSAAIDSIRELAGIELKTGRASPVQAAIITDESGRALMTVPASDAFQELPLPMQG